MKTILFICNMRHQAKKVLLMHMKLREQKRSSISINVLV